MRILLLWSGDILVTYAIAGALLYWLRHMRPSRLLWLAGGLIALMSVFYGVAQLQLSEGRRVSEQLANAPDATQFDEGARAAAQSWRQFR